MKTFYFTATGNSLYVAKRIGGEIYSIPQMLKEGKREFEDEAIGFIFPCYGFGLPRIVTDFIQKSNFKAKYFFAIMTYGNMAASGLKHMEEIGSKAGIQFNYTDELLMIDNYLPLFKMEDQLKKESSKQIEKNLEQIKKGFLKDMVSKPIHNLSAKFHQDDGDTRFTVHDNCNTCKVCEQVCPVSNIKVGTKPEFLHSCESCYACTHHCPQNAIHLKAERSTARFINQNVQLKEIIAANNQSNA
ncbi:MAG: 4Fe-4S ferredoxin, iron-sulpur binding protein [Sporomusa sp.]|nr:4Fe-4S ferredoxin, iron-sulpur binding protein [Sporomusa sp.]